ncbi:histidine phosphatase superfamily [Glomus cerebriforme]|uniref:Multiple inositol polyphosphate phosphatase 1 n=1 Tax=Glomus cerebriforme TaxID=658196 RepID=A0A397SKT4_9GLOM|nr:histidine phosphatase superfamily [Glomus cerebriforme]
MGTKTLPIIFTDKANPIKIPETCELQQLYLISRHGTRYPTDHDINKFIELETIFKNNSYTKEWYENPFPLLKQGLLNVRGEEELYLMGKRSRKRYHEFWDKILPYDPNIIKFQSSALSRTGMSGIAYSLGLLNGEGILGKENSQSVYISATPVSQDEELLMHHACSRWEETVKDSEILESQKDEFNTTYLTKIAKRISKSLLITPELLPDHVDYIYRACAFAIAFFSETKTWCSLLNKNEILELEYFNDIIDYYSFSYGSKLNEKLGCSLISNIIKSVENYLNGDSILKADLKFAHSETLQFLATTLGLFKDQIPLTVETLPIQLMNRKFKTSGQFYFASNVYFEIFTCAERNERSTTFIRTLVNEKSIIIPGCDSENCEWDKFKELLGDKLNCDFKKICEEK